MSQITFAGMQAAVGRNIPYVEAFLVISFFINLMLD